jgi:hypothetical protein
VVLADLAGTLTGLGIVTGPVYTVTPSAGSTNPSQLGTDIEALQTELQSLAAKSGITVADLSHLDADFQAIGPAWSSIGEEGLGAVTSELANAVAGGGSLSQAQSDFTAFIVGQGVSPTVGNQLLGDLVQAIQDSGVTASDLANVSALETAIETDMGMPPGGSAANADNFAYGGWFDQGYGYILGPTPTGGLLATGLDQLGVLSGYAPDVSSAAAPGQGGATLATGIQTLETELQGLVSSSGLTVADMSSLAADSLTIEHLTADGTEPGILFPAMSAITAAVVSGGSTAQAQAEFDAALPSGLPQSLLDQAFNDTVKAIQDSGVTATDVSNVTAESLVGSSPTFTLLVGSGLPSFELSATQDVNLNGQTGVAIPDPDWGPMVFTITVTASPETLTATPGTVTVTFGTADGTSPVTTSSNPTASITSSAGTANTGSDLTAAIATTSTTEINFVEIRKRAPKAHHSVTVKIDHKPKERVRPEHGQVHDKHPKT